MHIRIATIALALGLIALTGRPAPLRSGVWVWRAARWDSHVERLGINTFWTVSLIRAAGRW